MILLHEGQTEPKIAKMGFFLVETQGTDITEAFESAHVDIVKTRAILAKYFVRDIDTPRRTKFTFAPDGFYSTLRER